MKPIKVNQTSSNHTFWGLLLRGMGMGAADVIPGVSGGTIAFITGIYEKLLASISAFRPSLITTWRKQGFKTVWRLVNGRFLVAVFTGVVISVLSLAKLLSYLMEHEAVLLWAFFFGIILLSVRLVGATVQQWNARTITCILVGTAVAWWVSSLSPEAGTPHLWYIFLCGAVAACAMILPGISGSFILLLLGVYSTILGSITGVVGAVRSGAWELLSQHGPIIIVFAAGFLIGLVLFSRVLSYVFKLFRNETIALLTGFLIGSLNKVWPWKETVVQKIDRYGEPIRTQRNLLPSDYTAITGQDHQLFAALALALAGALAIVLLDSKRWSNRKKAPPSAADH